MSNLARFLADREQGPQDQEAACAELLAAIEAELQRDHSNDGPLIITDEERASWSPERRRLMESIEKQIVARDGEAAATQ